MILALALLLAVDLSAPRADRLRSIRLAPGPAAITAEFVSRQRVEGFNALLLYDFEGWNGDWVRAGDTRIASQLALAREQGMSVIVWMPALVPRADGSHVPIAHELLRERLRAWSRHDRGEIVGVFFMPDDAALLRLPLETQREWFSVAREVAPELPVLAIIGEHALAQRVTPGAGNASASLGTTHLDPASFDHLLWLVYPYNLAHVWGRRLDHLASANPDADLGHYLHDYAVAMKAAVFDQLAPGQLIIPVVQAFHYPGERPGLIPRDRDLGLQAHLVHRELQTTLGQTNNFSMTWFYATPSGTAPPYPEPLGIYDRADWLTAVVNANRWLAMRLAAGGRERRRSALPPR